MVEALDDGKRLDTDALRTQKIAPVLKPFFDKKCHTNERSIGLENEVDDALCSLTVGKEVVDEKHFVARAEEIFAYADIESLVFCE